jgi:5-methylcytosine-specific restriction endonuclease McrA
MTLRRYAPMKQSRGTTWPYLDRRVIDTRDGGRCVASRARFPESVLARCMGVPVERDHVRASHGIGMKSDSVHWNGVLLCPNCHRWKTDNGKAARPLLLAYLDRMGALGDALAEEIAS